MSDTTLPIAHRVWAEAQDKRRGSGGGRRMAPPDTVLFFDTETLVDRTQALTFGAYRYCRVTDGGLVCVEEGLFHADDLSTTDPAGFEILQRYSAVHEAETTRGRPLKLYSRKQFVERVFFRAAYEARARVVGFNLPFDPPPGWPSASPRPGGGNRGGFSLILSEGKLGSTAPGATPPTPGGDRSTGTPRGLFISFTKPMQPDDEDLIPDDSLDGQPDPTYRWPGRFLDLKTLAFTLTGESLSLERACRTFHVPGKADPGHHGEISEAYIDYCRQDVAATASLYVALTAEFAMHPIGPGARAGLLACLIGQGLPSGHGDRAPLGPTRQLSCRRPRLRHGRLLRRAGRVPHPQNPSPSHPRGLHEHVPDGGRSHGPARPPDRRADRGGGGHRGGGGAARRAHPRRLFRSGPLAPARRLRPRRA